MKSVLIVVEQFTMGGLETHICGEIQQLCAQGVSVHLAVGNAFDDALLPSCLSSVSSGISLEVSATPASLLAAINQLRAIIREHAIEAVHVHPFTSIIPAIAAAEQESVPVALTLHGPASLASYGPIYDFLIKDVILPNAKLIVTVSLEVKNLLSPHVADDAVIYIPNSVFFVDADAMPYTQSEIDSHWLVVSRLDAFKIKGILDFCIKAKAADISRVLIVGDGPAKADLVHALAIQELSDFVTLAGARPDVMALIQRSSGVAGMGRVVLEAVASKKPVVLVGYDGVKGVVDTPLLKLAAENNFSGRGLPTLDTSEFSAQLTTKVAPDIVSENYALAKYAFNECKSWRLFWERLSVQTRAAPSVISGLYQSLCANPVQDEIPYLQSMEIQARLTSILHGKKYYDARLVSAVSLCWQRRAVAERDGQITGLNQAVAERDGQITGLNQAVAERDGQITGLNQAVAERDGQITGLNQAVAERDGQITGLNQAVAERDGQITGLNQAVAERDGQIFKLNNEIIEIRQSTSWRIASPLRVAKNLVLAPKRTVYSVIRSLFWQLPAGLRQVLHGPRHTFVRFVRGLPSPQPQSNSKSAFSELSWTEFNEKVLSHRDEYKGVFIQELVIDWNVPLYQRPQHISTALGRLGYLVIYRTDNWAGDNVNGFREVSTNVWITNRYEIEEISGVVRSVYSTAYANTPSLLMKNGKRGRLVYEYIDHIDPEISGDQENIRRLLCLKDFAFGGEADFIVASAKKLYEEAVEAVGKGKVILVPNGVDTLHYRNPIHITTPIPETLVAFKDKHKAIVGYFGALAPWLWYDVIAELANQRPELGFVFIGPDYYGGSSSLPKAGNVLYLGTVDYKILPAHARQFDICFIPFKPGDIAKTTSPLKLFEYFALEKPVVVTADMNECTAYPEVFRGGSAVELSAAIDAAMQVKDHEAFKLQLRNLADQNDWIERARAMDVCFGGMKSEQQNPLCHRHPPRSHQNGASHFGAEKRAMG